MRKLSQENFQLVEDKLKSQARELEKARFSYCFCNGSSQTVLAELAKYQNKDGGFGHGLEPDFAMPASSPMASTIAFQIIEEIGADGADTLIERGIRYFENTFQPEYTGWKALSPEVNDFPHAPWWNYLPEQQMTVIDYSWGNPSAEIIGLLYKYRKYVKKLNVDALVRHVINYIQQKSEFTSEHEVYCFLRFYRKLPREKQTLLDEKLTIAIQSLVKTTVADWQKYTPQPVHFIKKPSDYCFGITQEAIETNLDYLVESLNTDNALLPNWNWGQYPEAWEIAKTEWTGVITLESLQILQSFGRIER